MPPPPPKPPPPPRKKLNWEQLSPSARDAAQKRALSGNWDAKSLNKVLGELAHVDEVLEQQAKSASNKMILFIILTVVSIPVGILLSEIITTAGAILLILTMLALAITFGVKRSKLKKQDLIDDFRLCLRPVLRDIANDLDHTKKIKVEMDLSGPVDTKQKSKQELPPGRYQKLTETVFLDPWCEVRLPLADGCTAILNFENCYRKLERRYRTSRGKTKWKTKWRKECTACATLLPPAAVRWNEQRLESRLDAQREKVKYLEKDGLPCARMERYWMFKAPSDPPSAAPHGHDVVGMLLRLHGAMTRPGEVAR